MKYVTPIIKQFMIQFAIGTIIEIFVIWLIMPETLTEVSDSLFICGSAFLIIGPIFLRPKEMGVPMQVAETGEIVPSVKFESTNNDESLVNLSEEEKKKFLRVDIFVVIVRIWGISFTLFFYSITLYMLWGN